MLWDKRQVNENDEHNWAGPTLESANTSHRTSGARDSIIPYLETAVRILDDMSTVDSWVCSLLAEAYNRTFAFRQALAPAEKAVELAQLDPEVQRFAVDSGPFGAWHCSYLYVKGCQPCRIRNRESVTSHNAAILVPRAAPILHWAQSNTDKIATDRRYLLTNTH